MTSAETVALIVAAGRGRRAGGGVPKQYRPVAGRALLRHTLDAFTDHARVGAIQVVIGAGDRPLYDDAVAGLALREPVIGGDDRQASVLNGLLAIAPLKPDQVVIHDAARPFVDAELISRTLDALARSPGAIAAVPLGDTLKRASDRDPALIDGTVARNGLWRAQTPQSFRFQDILAAHRAAAGAALSDDAAVAERAGLAVELVESTEENVKVTTADDLARAERLLGASAASAMRVGMGYDVHRFAAGGDHVMLCGIAVPHDRGLAGHSDADVGFHALVDALLGAVAGGDIGAHFPSSEARWRDADSSLFVDRARALVAEAGGMIVNVDITLICERPRIGPYREAMRERTAELLRIPAAQVSVKATSTDGLGFAGRGEGIAAQATACVRRGN